MRFRLWLGLGAVAAIAVGSVLGALLVRDKEMESFEQRQHEQALRAAHQAEAVAALSVNQLASAAAFHQTEEEVSPHEFEVMAASLLDKGILAGTAFLPNVEGSERAEFELQYRMPILERGSLGDLVPAAERGRYFPLAYAATDAEIGFGTPYGFDLGFDSVRRSYMLRAGDSGRPTATRIIRLLVGGSGINVFRPVYADGAPTATVAQRREALLGFVTGAFQAPDLAATATAALPERVEAQLLEEGRTVAGAELPRDDAAAAAIQIADRQWLLVVRDPDRPGVALPILMAFLGIALAALLGALIVIWSRNESLQELQLQANQDPLTGLKNRRRFVEDLRTEMARSRREHSEGALLMLDLDNFKRVNDTLGHSIGDRVIEEIAGVLRARARVTDVIARLGGDEFAMVLPHCGVEEALTVGEEIATAIRDHIPTETGVPPITASIGVAMFGPGGHDNLEALQVEADAAMYAAKKAGRDQVRVSAPEAVAQTQDSPS